MCQHCSFGSQREFRTEVRAGVDCCTGTDESEALVVRPEVNVVPKSGDCTGEEQLPQIGKFSSLKIFRRWPTTTKIRCTKIFQCQSDKVRIALLGYMKPVRGLPDHRRLFFFSHVTNSIRVRLAPCVAYTYLRLSHKLIFSTFNFLRCAQRQKYI